MGASAVQKHSVSYYRPWRKHPLVRALRTIGFYLLLIILFIPTGAIGWLRKRFPRLRKVLE